MNQKKRKNVIVVIVALIIALAIIPFMIFGLPRIINGPNNNVTRYLYNKYGNGSWQITKKEDVIKKVTTNFGPQNRKTGDKYTISSSFLREKFTVTTDNDGKIIEDYFLPAYYSEKYDISYYREVTQFGITAVEHDLYRRMKYIIDYHYPYGGRAEDPYRVICQLFSEDNLPNFHRIPEMEEIIKLIEDKCCKNRVRNTDNNDEELYKLVFNKDSSWPTIRDYISKHIAPINMEAVKVLDEYDK